MWEVHKQTSANDNNMIDTENDTVPFRYDAFGKYHAREISCLLELGNNVALLHVVSLTQNIQRVLSPYLLHGVIL